MAIRIEDDVAELFVDLGRTLQAMVTIVEATDAELAAKAQLDPDGALLTADGLHTAMKHRCDVFREMLVFSERKLRAAVAIRAPGLIIPFPKPEATS
jgi:hypothetical protein